MNNKIPSKRMRREYTCISVHDEWKWHDNSRHQESYLHLAGHRIATVKTTGWGFEAHCPGGLVATRKSIKAAKAAAVDAVNAWIQCAMFCIAGNHLCLPNSLVSKHAF